MINDEEPLTGGNMGGATRVGDTVRRTAGPWSPTIQRLLRHLRDHGVDWVPAPLGVDERGRDNVSYLPGLVPNYPLPDWIWTDDVLADAGRRMAQLHRATATFDTTDAVWQLESRSPAEVVCHNDFAPYNMVFSDGRLSGVIDWDTASPGSRVWDLAYLAYRLVPLTEPGNIEAGPVDPGRRAGRLALLCDAYTRAHADADSDGFRAAALPRAASDESRRGDIGATVVGMPAPADVLPVVVERLHALAEFTQARADEGNEYLLSHVDLYRRDAAWVADMLMC